MWFNDENCYQLAQRYQDAGHDLSKIIGLKLDLKTGQFSEREFPVLCIEYDNLKWKSLKGRGFVVGRHMGDFFRLPERKHHWDEQEKTMYAEVLPGTLEEAKTRLLSEAKKLLTNRIEQAENVIKESELLLSAIDVSCPAQLPTF